MADGRTKRKGGTNPQPTEGEWAEYPSGTVYRCQVYLAPEAEGGFSVVAATLPGVASQGKTEQEALANIREALVGVIEVYKSGNTTIPWSEQPREPDDPQALIRWVVVHV